MNTIKKATTTEQQRGRELVVCLHEPDSKALARYASLAVSRSHRRQVERAAMVGNVRYATDPTGAVFRS